MEVDAQTACDLEQQLANDLQTNEDSDSEESDTVAYEWEAVRRSKRFLGEILDVRPYFLGPACARGHGRRPNPPIDTTNDEHSTAAERCRWSHEQCSRRHNFVYQGLDGKVVFRICKKNNWRSFRFGTCRCFQNYDLIR